MANAAWTYDQSAALFRCAASGCTYANGSPNAVQLHYYAKHGRKTAPPQPARERHASGHQHEWRVLGNTPSQRRARQAGYREVCAECLALR